MGRMNDFAVASALVAGASAFLLGCGGATGPVSCKPDPAAYVDPFIGTEGNGHTFPGATCPFGAVQPSPVTGSHSWKYCSGYQFSDRRILGFSQTHLSGTGCTDLGDVLIQPFAGGHEIDMSKWIAPESFGAEKADERAEAGYYEVSLPEFNTRVRMTATPHVALYDINFSRPGAQLLVDLQFGDTSGWCTDVQHRVLTNATELAADRLEICGSSLVSNWIVHAVSYSVQFDRPWTNATRLAAADGERAPRYVLDFGDLENLKVKVGLSSVSVDNARENVVRELPDFGFERVRKAARARWNELLGRMEFDCTPTQATNLYTALYHLFIQPNEWADVNGEYRGADLKVHKSRDGHHYTNLSFWDTFRAANPLYTILIPEMVPSFVETILAHRRDYGELPIQVFGGWETYTMIGHHSVQILADACIKGLVKDKAVAEEAYEGVKDALYNAHGDAENQQWDLYDKYGYIPFDRTRWQSVSRTLEAAGDNNAAAKFALILGRNDDAAEFVKRAGFYKNLYDPSVGFMRGRDSKGSWREPFDPMFVRSRDLEAPFDFVEGNSWQWSWHVMHDPWGLIRLFGGKEATERKLDEFFSLENDPVRSGYVNDVTGYVGQYAHGNEPSHHVAYLYDFIDRPEKGQALIRKICDSQYAPRPDGLCGNDDCGQMSAWLLFSSCGFYPFDPVGGIYVLGAPQVRRATLHLAGGRTFTVVAKDLSPENVFVKSVRLNGKPLDRDRLLHITHDEVMRGGELVFEMTSEK